jgi:hypothetical protein
MSRVNIAGTFSKLDMKLSKSSQDLKSSAQAGDNRTVASSYGLNQGSAFAADAPNKAQSFKSGLNKQITSRKFLHKGPRVVGIKDQLSQSNSGSKRYNLPREYQDQVKTLKSNNLVQNRSTEPLVKSKD